MRPAYRRAYRGRVTEHLNSPGWQALDPDRRHPWYVVAGILVMGVVILGLTGMFAAAVIAMLVTGW